MRALIERVAAVLAVVGVVWLRFLHGWWWVGARSPLSGLLVEELLQAAHDGGRAWLL